MVSRACFVDDGARRRFQNLDGPYLEELASAFENVLLLAPIYRKGCDPQYEMLQNYTFEFHAPNIEVMEMPEARGSRRLAVLLATFWQQIRVLRQAFRRHPGALTYIFFPTYRAAAAALYCRLARRPYIAYSGILWLESVGLFARWGGRRPWYLGLYVAASRALERIALGGAKVRLLTVASQIRAYEQRGPTYRTRPLVRVQPLANLPKRPLAQPARLLCVGAVIPRKGHDTLYETVASLGKKGLPVTVTMAGAADSDWQKHLDQLADRLGISSQISYLGWLPEQRVEQLYNESDLFVLPTRSEGFPRVVYEAMGRGLPVVTTSIPNIAEVIEDQRQALLVPPDDPVALATAIERLLQDERLRARLTATAWRWVREQFSETAAEQFVSLVKAHGPW